MNHYVQTLDARFDGQGYRGEPIPFHVVLDASAISCLIEDAEHAQRVYELFLIHRPGDVWKYVLVQLIELPKRLREASIVVRLDPGEFISKALVRRDAQ